MDVVAVEVEVGDTGGEFPGAPAATAKIEVMVWPDPSEYALGAIIGTALPGEEQAGQTIAAANGGDFSIRLMHPGAHDLCLNRERTTNPGNLAADDKCSLGGDVAGVDDVGSKMTFRPRTIADDAVARVENVGTQPEV